MVKKLLSTFFALLIPMMSIPISVSAVTLMNEVYCKPGIGTIGDGTSGNPVVSLKQAIDLVEPGGTIYLMNTYSLSEDFIGKTAVLDGKGATVKPMMSSSQYLINLQPDEDLTFTNITFDGSTYSSPTNMDMIQVQGKMTLGEGTTITNFSSSYYGAALAVYGEAVLDGCTILNIRCGALSGSYGGGVYVSGKLTLKSGTITGNTMTSGEAADVSLYGNGQFLLDGDATVGTVVINSSSTDARIYPTSTLKSSINVRNNSYNSYYGILNKDFSSGRIIAQGAPGYTFTKADAGKLVLASPNAYGVDFNSSAQGEVSRANYAIELDSNMVNGAIELPSPATAKWGDRATFTVKPNAGYQLSSMTIKNPDSPYKESYTNNNNGTYSFTMPKADLGQQLKVVISATFTVAPAKAPVIDTQPQDVSVPLLGNTTLSVQAHPQDSGTLSYQWYKADGTEITGATGASLPLSAVTADNEGGYYVTITNTTAAGATETIQSNTCTVTVVPPKAPVIDVQPQNTAALEGEKTVLSVQAHSQDNGTLSYQWYKDGTAIAGANGASYTLTKAALGDAGSYSVTVTNTISTGASISKQSVTCTLLVNKVVVEVQHPDEITAELPNKSDVLDTVLTPEDRVQISTGIDVSILLKVVETQSPADAPVVESILKENDRLGIYLDVELIKKIGLAAEEKITQTDKPILITFAIPETLRAPRRIFTVVRVHDGQTDILPDLDDNPDTFTMETDRFSTYALVYEVAPESNTKPPVTGDRGIATPLWVTACTLAVAGMVLYYKRYPLTKKSK